MLGRDDECDTAGEIYSCGRQKEPTMVDAIFNAEKGNATIVWLRPEFLYELKIFLLANTNSILRLYLAFQLLAPASTRG